MSTMTTITTMPRERRPTIMKTVDDIPLDRLAYFCMLCLGIGSLLPWNAFITAVDYYQHFYPQYHPDRVIPVLYMTINVIVTGLLVKFGSAVSINRKILSGFAGYAVAMFGVPVCDKLLFPTGADDMHGEGNMAAMVITLSFVAVIAVTNGFVQGSLFGMCGPLPLVYTGAAVIGTAISGVFISVLRIGTKIAFGDSPDGLSKGIYVYFASGGLFSLFCIYLHQKVVPDLPIMRWHHAVTRVNEQCKKGEQSPLLGDGGASKVADNDMWSLVIASSMERLKREGTSNGQKRGSFDLEAPGSSHGQDEVKLIPVFKRLWTYAMAVFFAYLVTLSIFPGVLAENLKSPTLKSWYSLFLITVFNVGDMTGKMCPPKFQVKDGGLLFCFSIMRLAFVPIYAIFVQEGMSDVAFFVVTSCLGLTNGYLTTCAMSTAPTLFRPQESEVAGTMMVFFLLFGLSTGAMAGWLWVFL